MTMENTTNNYKHDNERHLQFSSKQKNGSNSDMLVLDLSCKERVPLILPVIKETRDEIKKENLPTDLSQTSAMNASKRLCEQINLLDEDKQTSPVAGSSAMLSPYSEPSSPKRTKTESMDYYENNYQLKHTALANMLPRDIIPGVTMVTPQHPPSLLMLPNEAKNIPFIVPTHTMSIPYIEASQSFMTNEAKRKVPFAVPAECSTSTEMKLPTSSLDTLKKMRPFKAYSKNMLPMIPTLDYNSNEEFAKFCQHWMEERHKTPRNTSNPKMRRVSKSPGLPTSTVNEKDAAYYERRRKNNEAAKRSRDARRAKEDELAMRAAFLERENSRLKCEMKALKIELQKYTNNYNFIF
ncbi:thyrotroph embryonic factor [Monomorium pharaonis]|uniref:thyrotroph embryonic factor n=1 Tax=Monomorium pharaonis TaxID=307658 RepID=UPI00102E1F06|nr:thyrotroph embryonic factor [Monomorium pharaonis]